MALFHFDNNREARLDAPQKPIVTNSEPTVEEFNNTVWNNEFEDELGIGDSYIAADNGKTIISNKNKNGREIIEHHTIFIPYSSEELLEIRDDEKSKSIQEKYVNKEKNKLREKFPEYRYDIEIKADGNRLEVYIYDKEYETLKKEDNAFLNEAANEFMSGNFNILNQVKNPVEFLRVFREQSGGKTMYSYLIDAYKEGKIEKDMLVGRLYTLSQMFSKFEEEYESYNPESKFISSNFLNPYEELLNRVQVSFQRYDELHSKYKNNEVDREQVKELQKLIKDKYNVELNEVAASSMLSDFKNDYGIYNYNFEELKNYYKDMGVFDNEYKDEYYLRPYDGDIDKNKIKELQKLIKDTYNEDITESATASMINSWVKYNAVCTGIDFDKIKSDCKNGTLTCMGYECKDYLDNILTYSGNGYNDSLESLEEVAQTTEIEYGRYNFDIHKSPVADLAYKSEKMINNGEKELQVTKTDDKIVIKNKSTGKERVIDLNMLTSKLDDEHKQTLLNALNGFNKISLWEFAIEITKGVDNNIESRIMALAQYDIEKDKISIGDKVDSNTLLHEMIHAMMTTIIDGKNTSNEDLFKEFVDTFKREQIIHNRDKQLRNSIIASGNYNYCAEDIHEFAAEAGCLWLSGKSDSEFTIATHFPESYRLFVHLIEKIRAQETGRSTN